MPPCIIMNDEYLNVYDSSYRQKMRGGAGEISSVKENRGETYSSAGRRERKEIVEIYVSISFFFFLDFNVNSCKEEKEKERKKQKNERYR